MADPMSLRVVLVTGLSGSGKSTTIRALEDAGHFCVDNLPAQLLGPLLDLHTRSPAETNGVAVCMDVRESSFLGAFEGVVDDIRRRGYRPEVLYLEASDEILLRRFQESRRSHPLDEGHGAADGIRRERKLLDPIRSLANEIIDTTSTNVHDLRRSVLRRFGQRGSRQTRLRFISFGFKYGTPRDAHLMLDVRFLPNPYFVDALRERDGKDSDVAAYALESKEGKELIERYLKLIRFLLPCYDSEGRPYVNVAVGCTGGRHRSVATVEALSKLLTESGRELVVEHRDRHRDSAVPSGEEGD